MNQAFQHVFSMIIICRTRVRKGTTYVQAKNFSGIDGAATSVCRARPFKIALRNSRKVDREEWASSMHESDRTPADRVISLLSAQRCHCEWGERIGQRLRDR